MLAQDFVAPPVEWWHLSPLIALAYAGAQRAATHPAGQPV